MIAIEVNFLTGRFVATTHHDREIAEWPPHPARLFSALAATWADADSPDETERAALEWLESQPPPAITAAENAASRSVVTHFVPVNDTGVIGSSWYRRQAERVAQLYSEFETELEASLGEVTTKVARLQQKLVKQRDVRAQVTGAGRTNPDSAVQLLPDHRAKQARHYPSVGLPEPRVTYTWDATPAEEVQSVFDSLLARVTRVGHSSSLVSCRLVPDPPAPSRVPGPTGEVLRWVREGQLAALEREHMKHQASKPRSLPFVAVRYEANTAESSDKEPLRPDTSGEWIIFEFSPSSRRYPAQRTVGVAQVLRAAVFHHAGDPMPEGLSGHRQDGSPSTNPHVGFLPLPYVGYEHANGTIMGAAVAIPHLLDEMSRTAVLRAIGHWEDAPDPLTLTLGKQGILELTRQRGPIALVTLRPGPWRRPARTWVSATPIALPVNPGPLSKGGAVARSKAWARGRNAVVESCRHVGLPEPADVTVSLAPYIQGTIPAHRFPAFRQTGRDGSSVARRLVHASVTFDDLVIGPLVLGAGRYLGLGLMRPLDKPEPVSDETAGPEDLE